VTIANGDRHPDENRDLVPPSGASPNEIPAFAGMTGNREELVQYARETIRRGSKSFAAASRLFDRDTREKVWLLYAWCRRCDDLADAQELGGELGDQSGAQDRLATIRALTAKAFAGEPTGDPAFDAFGLVARETGITPAMAEDVIAGFALDADEWRPRSEGDLMRYCFHVAGAVGVMPTDDDTLDRACDLGLAFQLANIARDIKEDNAAGRCYLPTEWLAEADVPPGMHVKPNYRVPLVALAGRLVALARVHERSSRIGAARLRFRQRWAVLSAAGIYGAIAEEVARRGVHAWDRRVFTSRPAKLGFAAKALLQALLPPPVTSKPEWTRRQLAADAAA
jgi:phytoene synthase